MNGKYLDDNQTFCPGSMRSRKKFSVSYFLILERSLFFGVIPDATEGINHGLKEWWALDVWWGKVQILDTDIV